MGNDEEQDCYKVSEVKQYFNLYNKCFTFFPETNITLDRTGELYILVIRINMSDAWYRNLAAVIHDPYDDLVWNPSLARRSIRIDRNFRTAITFSQTKITQMPHPFSKCIDYPKIYGTTRNTLINRCTIDGYNQRFNPHTILPLNGFAGSDAYFEMNVSRFPIEYNCSKKYPPECSRRLFHLHVLEENESHSGQTDATLFVTFPSMVFNEITMRPLLNGLDFACNIASTTSLWLGVSIAGFIKLFSPKAKARVFVI